MKYTLFSYTFKGRVGNFRKASNSKLALKAYDPKVTPSSKHMTHTARACKASRSERWC